MQDEQIASFEERGGIPSVPDELHTTIPNLFAYKKLKLDSFQSMPPSESILPHPRYAG
jgi:hypothetical protein